jgi:outer membrane protein OmpA-like peptidoglycan-associated protein
MMMSYLSHGRRPLRVMAVALTLTLAACAQPQPNTDPSSAAAAAPAKPPPSSAPSDVQLFFDDGSTRLSASADQKLDEAARLYREGNPVVMFVSGHADSVGGEYQNLVLSGERAKVAKQALVARGIPADRLQLRAMGTSLPTDPNTPLPENNRRVVITWR